MRLGNAERCEPDRRIRTRVVGTRQERCAAALAARKIKAINQYGMNPTPICVALWTDVNGATEADAAAP
jgi:hypothetical protein